MPSLATLAHARAVGISPLDLAIDGAGRSSDTDRDIDGGAVAKRIVANPVSDALSEFRFVPTPSNRTIDLVVEADVEVGLGRYGTADWLGCKRTEGGDCQRARLRSGKRRCGARPYLGSSRNKIWLLRQSTDTQYRFASGTIHNDADDGLSNGHGGE